MTTPKERCAEALASAETARTWVAGQDIAIAVCFEGMRIAKALFEHAALARALLDRYVQSNPSPFRVRRPLFDAGERALALLRLGPAGAPVPVRRARTEAWLDEDVYLVDWRKATPSNRPDGHAHGLGMFRSMNSLFASMYDAQMTTKRLLPPTFASAKVSDDPFQLAQLASATQGALTEMFGYRELSLDELPVIAVAAGIDTSSGARPLADLLEELRGRGDKWRQKPNLNLRRRPLRGRVRYATDE